MAKRRDNPSGGTVALYVGGAAVAGLAGFLIYKAVKKPAADAAPGTPPGGGATPGGVAPSATLPTFDPKNTDMTHAYVIAVNTANPVTDDQVPDPKTIVADYLTPTSLEGKNPVTQLRVYGPITKDDKLDPTTIAPKPDLVIVASMAGDTLMALSASQVAKLKEP